MIQASCDRIRDSGLAERRPEPGTRRLLRFFRNMPLLHAPAMRLEGTSVNMCLREATYHACHQGLRAALDTSSSMVNEAVETRRVYVSSEAPVGLTWGNKVVLFPCIQRRQIPNPI